VKIIILGAGQVGGTLAEHLASEANDITVVDNDANRLRELTTRLDIRTVRGAASFPWVLRKAGAEDADMLVAVTNSDETNMVACQVAYSLFHTPMKIARVRETAYLTHSGLFSNEAIPVDVLISPEQLVTHYIRRLIEYPGALQVLDFAGGKAQLVAIRAQPGSQWIDQSLFTLQRRMPTIQWRIAAIFRRGQPLELSGHSEVQVGDELFFIAAREHIPDIMQAFQPEERYRRIIIGGGGHIGERLAEAIETRYQVKIIELSSTRCRQLAEVLSNTLVLNGSASDRELLLEENIATTDLFLALTQSDEANIMSSLLARRLGARKVMTLINNPAYVDLIQGGTIDVAISPQLATIGTLLSHVRRGDIHSAHSLRGGAAEAIELVAHGDAKNSRVVGRKTAELNLPPGTRVGAIIRDEAVLIASDDLTIAENDHVILFLPEKKYIREVERLFQVSWSFF